MNGNQRLFLVMEIKIPSGRDGEIKTLMLVVRDFIVVGTHGFEPRTSAV